jgi:hypothetical protein
MLGQRLHEHPEIKELVYFLIGRVDRAQLVRRQWMKPEPRYQQIWWWIQTRGRLVRRNAEIVVTRYSVKLRS